MRYAGIEEFEVNNGEGVGCSLFVQGCHFHCKNCFNQETWDFSGGEEWTPETQTKFLEIINKPYITRVSILGGEPLADENVDTINNLIFQIPKEKKIWIYTGYKFEDIIKSVLVSSQEDFKRINNTRYLTVALADVLVDGQYIDKLKNLSLPFRGSSNQRLIDMQKTINNNFEIILWENK